MRKVCMKIPGAKRHPSKDVEIRFGGQPIHVDVFPKGNPSGRPVAPHSHVWLWDLQCKACRGASGVNVTMVVPYGQRQIQMRPQQIDKPDRDGPRCRGRFAGESPKVSIGGRPACPHQLMSGMTSGEKGGNSGNAESEACAHTLPRD